MPIYTPITASDSTIPTYPPAATIPNAPEKVSFNIPPSIGNIV